MNIRDFLEKFSRSQQVLLAFGETYHGAHELVISEIVRHFSGFSGIFLEKPVSQQADIDEYLSTGIINDRLTSHFQNSLREGKDIKGTLLMILDAAKKNMVPVFCVDSSKEKTVEYSKESSIGRYYLRGSSRDEDIFENIQRLVGVGERYLFFGGFQHLKSGLHFRSNESTLGSRLRSKYGVKFYNLIIYKLKNDDKIMINNNHEVIDFRESAERRIQLEVFLKNSGIEILDSEGKHNFDGCILHR